MNYINRYETLSIKKFEIQDKFIENSQRSSKMKLGNEKNLYRKRCTI